MGWFAEKKGHRKGGGRSKGQGRKWAASRETSGQIILTKDRIAGGPIFHGEETFNVTLARRKPTRRIEWSLLLLHADTDDGMIPFAAKTAAENVNAFEWVGQPHPQIALSSSGIWTPTNTWFLGFTRVIQKVSRSGQRFRRAHESDQHTHTQTDHATPSVAIGRYR